MLIRTLAILAVIVCTINLQGAPAAATQTQAQTAITNATNSLNGASTLVPQAQAIEKTFKDKYAVTVSLEERALKKMIGTERTTIKAALITAKTNAASSSTVLAQAVKDSKEATEHLAGAKAALAASKYTLAVEESTFVINTVSRLQINATNAINSGNSASSELDALESQLRTILKR